MVSHAFAKYGIWYGKRFGQRAAGREQVHSGEKKSCIQITERQFESISMHNVFQYSFHISVTKQQTTKLVMVMCSLSSTEHYFIPVAKAFASLLASRLILIRWKAPCLPSFVQPIIEDFKLRSLGSRKMNHLKSTIEYGFPSLNLFSHSLMSVISRDTDLCPTVYIFFSKYLSIYIQQFSLVEAGSTIPVQDSDCQPKRTRDSQETIPACNPV